MTARHCFYPAELGSTTSVEFGRFYEMPAWISPDEDPTMLARRDAYINHRLAELGLTLADMGVFSDRDLDGLTSTTCSFVANGDARRDLQYWWCDAFEPQGAVRSLAPGVLWGWVPPGGRPEGGDRLSMLGVNQLTRDEVAFQVLHASDGKVTREHVDEPGGLAGGLLNPCGYDGEFDFDRCFHHTLDSRGGWSGAIIVDRASGQAIGVNSGGVRTDGRSTRAAYESRDLAWAANVGAPFDSLVDRFGPTPEPPADFKPTRGADLTAGTGAGMPNPNSEVRYFDAACAPWEALVGVAALGDGWLATLAVVCAPLEPDRPDYLGRATVYTADPHKWVDGLPDLETPYWMSYAGFRGMAALQTDSRRDVASIERGTHEAFCANPVNAIQSIDVAIASDGGAVERAVGVLSFECDSPFDRGASPELRDLVSGGSGPLGVETRDVKQLGCDDGLELAGLTVGVGFSGVETMTALCRKTL